jgi:hypothetical protein
LREAHAQVTNLRQISQQLEALKYLTPEEDGESFLMKLKLEGDEIQASLNSLDRRVKKTEVVILIRWTRR